MRKLGGLAALLVSIVVSPVHTVGQETSAVAGVVRGPGDRPLMGVLVFVDDGTLSTTTDATGSFQLAGVSPGTHVLSYRQIGFAPRSFNLVVQPGPAVRDVGAVVLPPGPAPAATLRGAVTEQVGGQPLAGAVISLNGNFIARSDSVGGFTVPAVPVQWGTNVVTVTHSAFNEASAADTLFVSSHDETLDLLVSLDVAPVALPSVAVEAAPTRSVRLESRGFYERMAKSSNGVFWTSQDIVARDVGDWDELLRGVRFPRTRAAGTFGRSQTGVCGRDTEPLAFLDGAHIGDLLALVDGVRVETIEGMEIYRSVADLPIEFNIMGAECGVVVVWTRVGRGLPR